jgi:hypothetical protein
MKANEMSNHRSLRTVRACSSTVVALLMTIAVTAVLASSAVAAVFPPGVYTDGTSALTPTSVVLHGGVNPKAQATNYVFQYGTTKAYGGQTSFVALGNGKVSIKVSRGIGGLRPNTLYHYRIAANSVGGTTHGGDHVFKTPKVPLSLQIAGTPNPVLFSDPFTVQGALAGTGGAGRVVALQFNPFPYTAGFKTLGNSEVTTSTGGFSFPVVGISTNTQLRVVTTSAPFVSSPVLLEGVAVRVTFHIHRVHRHRKGRFYHMYGTVAPAEVGARVGFQLLRPGLPSSNEGGTFVRSGTTTVSRFSTIVRIRHRGLYQALVQVADGSHVSAYSTPIRIH